MFLRRQEPVVHLATIDLSEWFCKNKNYSNGFEIQESAKSPNSE